MEGLHHQGFLRKRGHRFKNWKRRFFVLHDDALTYSERQGSKIKGQLRLRATSVVMDVELKRFGKPFCMSILETPDSDNPLFIQGASTDDMLVWRDAILRTISACAGISPNITLAQQRRMSSRRLSPTNAAPAEEATAPDVQPSWIKAGQLNRALKDDWQPNYFILHANGLLQGFAKRGGKLITEVNIAKFEVRTLSPVEIGGHANSFQLLKPKTKIPLVLQASSEEECTVWLSEITGLQALLKGGASPKVTDAPEPSTPTPAENGEDVEALSSQMDRGSFSLGGPSIGPGRPAHVLAQDIIAAATADTDAESAASVFGAISGLKLVNPDVHVEW